MPKRNIRSLNFPLWIGYFQCWRLGTGRRAERGDDKKKSSLRTPRYRYKPRQRAAAPDQNASALSPNPTNTASATLEMSSVT